MVLIWTMPIGPNGATSEDKSDGLKEIGPAWIDDYLTFDYYSGLREAGAANLKLLASGRAATQALYSRLMKRP